MIPKRLTTANLSLLLGCFLLGDALFAGARAQGVYRIELDKAIHPITKDYVVRAIGQANAKKAEVILLAIDTPGGYVASVESIQRAVLQSKAPVVAYVAPAGARATSGGAMVALACDLIAMAPGTTIGSAHPVSGSQVPSPLPPQENKPPGDRKEAEKAVPREAEVMMQKVVNDLAAHMRSIAENRGRNPSAAEAMIRESISASSHF